MKKISQYVFIAIFIFSITGLSLARGGGFYADRQIGVYHMYGHDEAQPVDEKNLVTFNTREDAEEAGYKPCEACFPNSNAETEHADTHQ